MAETPENEEEPTAEDAHANTLTQAPSTEWPVHFPSSCPPNAARDLNDEVFMLVASNPPSPKDLECAIDRNSFRDKPQCQRASLSCALKIDHLRELRQNSSRLRNHRIASGFFKPEHGKLQQTGRPEHYSMWLRAKCLAIGHTMFTVQS